MSFFRAAFLEEGIKFALLIFFCVRLSELNEPMDAIVYGAAIGLGYAAIENIGYLNYGGKDYWSGSIFNKTPITVSDLPVLLDSTQYQFNILNALTNRQGMFIERRCCRGSVA